MQINQTESDTVVLGDIKENKVGIDINNIGFITHILSTNLYSKPIESFLRETVSNAWDSHIEAGCKEPILLEIGTDIDGKDYCKIRDFGIGLSPERFNSIYRNIGSSTKRGDNLQIGGFGIGRFSPLSYTNKVYLTSNYDGVQYKYLMYKDGSDINIDELFTVETTDRNGLEVMVYINKYDIKTFFEAIQSQLIFFEDLFISIDNYQKEPLYRSTVEAFNNLKIKKYNTFIVNTCKVASTITVCLGKIQYPLDTSIIRSIGNYPICVNFDIGELNVTPNRETILYDSKTIKKIEDRLLLVQEELNTILEPYRIVDYLDLYEYVCRKPSSTVTLLDNIVLYLTPKKTYKGEDLSSGSKFFRDVFDRVCLQGSKCTGSKLFLDRMYLFGLISEKQKVVVGNISSFKPSTKKYLLNSSIGFILPHLTLRDLIKIFKSNKLFNNYTDLGTKYMYKYMYRYLIELYSQLPKFTNSDVPKEFLDSLKVAKVKKEYEEDSISMGTLRYSDRSIYNALNVREHVVSDASNRPINDVVTKYTSGPKYKNKQVIYSFKGDSKLKDLFCFINPSRYSTASKYIFIEVSKSNLSLLSNTKNFTNIKEFMKYRYLRAVATAYYITREYPHIYTLETVRPELLDEVSTKLKEVVTEITEYLRLYNIKGNEELHSSLKELCNEIDCYDPDMMGYLEANDKLLRNSKFLEEFVYNKRITHLSFVIDYILARKLFIPNYRTVMALKDNKNK